MILEEFAGLLSFCKAPLGAVDVLTSGALENGKEEGVALLPNAPKPAGDSKTEAEDLMAEKALDSARAVASLNVEGVVGAFGSMGLGGFEGERSPGEAVREL